MACMARLAQRLPGHEPVPRPERGRTTLHRRIAGVGTSSGVSQARYRLPAGLESASRSRKTEGPNNRVPTPTVARQGASPAVCSQREPSAQATSRRAGRREWRTHDRAWVATIEPPASRSSVAAVVDPPERTTAKARKAVASAAIAPAARSAAVTGGSSRLESMDAGDDRTLGFLGRDGPTHKIPEQVGVLQIDQLQERVAFSG